MTREKIICIISFIAAFACQDPAKIDESKLNTEKVAEIEESRKVDSVNTIAVVEDVFSISDFKIGVREIGPVKIGMTIEEVEQQLSGFTKEETTSYEFKFGGGGQVNVYKYDEEPVLATMTGFNSDTITVALHEDLKTSYGLNPRSVVGELVEIYPNIMVNQDLMSGGEFMEDTIHNWLFVFDTNDDNEIGEYPTIDIPSEPKRMDIKTDWIIVR